MQLFNEEGKNVGESRSMHKVNAATRWSSSTQSRVRKKREMNSFDTNGIANNRNTKELASYRSRLICPTVLQPLSGKSKTEGYYSLWNGKRVLLRSNSTTKTNRI